MSNYTGTRLAVPPMHPSIPNAIRARVLDYVRRRLIVEAIGLAEDAESDRLAELHQDRHIGRGLMIRARRHDAPDSRGRIGRRAHKVA